MACPILHLRVRIHPRNRMCSTSCVHSNLDSAGTPRPSQKTRRTGRSADEQRLLLWGSMSEMWWWRRGWRGCGRGWTKILLIEFRGCSIDHSFHGVPEIFLVNLFGNVVPHLLFGFDIFSYQFIDHVVFWLRFNLADVAGF